MSPDMRRLVVIALAVEVLVCGWLLAGRLRRPRAALPAVFLDDPLLAAEFAFLAERAEAGGADEWLFLGESLLGQGCYGHAERAFERALEFAPHSTEAAYALGFAVDRTGRVAESTIHYQRCLDAPDDPRSPQSKKPFALFAIGRNHLRLGNIAAAEAAFRRNEGFTPATYQLAKILYHGGRPKEAAAVLARLLEEMPLSLELHRLRARVMEQLGEPAEQFVAAAMEERSSHVIESYFGGEFVRPFNRRHGLQRLLDAYEEGKASMTMAVRERELSVLADLVRDRRIPQRFIALYMWGEWAIMAGRPIVALEMVRQIADGGDASGDRLLLEADAKQMQGADEAARVLRERAESLQPTVLGQRALADDCDRRGDPAGRDRHRAKEFFLAAMANYRTDELAPALELLRRSAAIVPEDATTWFHIGEMEYHLGRLDAADEAFRQALALRPGYGRARDYLERRAP